MKSQQTKNIVIMVIKVDRIKTRQNLTIRVIYDFKMRNAYGVEHEPKRKVISEFATRESCK